MIPLNKNPDLRPIEVGEVLRRISGEVVMMISKQDVMKAAGSLQVFAGLEAGAEAAIHAVHDIFIDHTKRLFCLSTLKTHLTQQIGKLCYIISQSYVPLYLPT